MTALIHATPLSRFEMLLAPEERREVSASPSRRRSRLTGEQPAPDNDGRGLSNTDNVPSQSELIARDRFRSVLSSKVSMPGNGVEYALFRNAVIAYEFDWKALLTCREGWIRFLRRAVIVKTVVAGQDDHGFASAQVAEASDAWQEGLLRGIVWPLELQSALDASLANLMPEIAAEILRENIVDCVNLIATAMAQHLTLLVERGVLGCITWHGQNACQYSYLEREIEATTNLVTPNYGARITRDAKRKMAWQEATAEGVCHRRTIAHIHDVIDAVKSDPRNAMSVIPRRQQQILDAAPHWLEGLLSVVEGNLIRQRHICQDLDSEVWTRTADIVVPAHFDPAIVLSDSYVLSGWVPAPNEQAEVQPTLRTLLSKLF